VSDGRSNPLSLPLSLILIQSRQTTSRSLLRRSRCSLPTSPRPSLVLRYTLAGGDTGILAPLARALSVTTLLTLPAPLAPGLDNRLFNPQLVIIVVVEVLRVQLVLIHGCCRLLTEQDHWCVDVCHWVGASHDV